jgi:uncharacterized membrane protein YhhN
LTAAVERFPGRAERALLVFSIASALVWAAAAWRDADSGILLTAKVATVGALALAALRRRHEIPGGALLGVALVAHAAGDLLIELFLLAGVAAFLAGHFGYLRLFWRERKPIHEIGGGTKLALGLVALTGAGFVAYLAPRLTGAQRMAIPLYVAALLGMAGSALICRRGRPWLPLGALLFVGSDALLSLELFGRGVAGGRFLVWPLYAAAQMLIAFGWIGGGRRKALTPAEQPAAAQ